MIRTYKFLLKPNADQITQLNNMIGSTRFIWNYMLDLNIKQYKQNKTFIWAFDMQKLLPKLKENNSWLKNIPSQSLQQKCNDLQQALKMTSKKRSKKFGFPKFKSKKYDGSFRIPQTNNHIKFDKNSIQIPKIGKINWIQHRPIHGILKNITIKQENDRWYVCVCCELQDINYKIDENKSIGIDLGLKTFLVTSNNEIVDTPKFYRKSEQKIKKLSKQLSKKKKGSKNRNKARSKLAKQHLKIRNQRKDFLHKLSHKFSQNYDLICIEDLDLAQMKTKFGKSTSDQGIGEFIHQLEYKAKKLIKINRYFPSSQICSSCFNRNNLLKLSDRIYSCNSCNFIVDRDLNAAINIKVEGIRQLNTAGTAGIYACQVQQFNEIAADISKIATLKQEKFLDLSEKPNIL
jgi:putative transposase